MDETPGEASTRHPTTRLTRWFLLTGNRLLVSLVMLFGIGAAFSVVSILEIATVTAPSRVMWYLNGTVNGLLTLIPIAVGVNQIVLSHEFGSIQDLYERRVDITDFRERVEERTDTTVSSPHASTFFGTLLSSVADAGRALRERRDRQADDCAADEIRVVATSVIEQADRANDELSADGTSMLRTLLVVLTYHNSRHFYEVRRLRTEGADRDPETAEALGRITDLFLEIDAARQFLKTVVVERQLARLSRLLIYTVSPCDHCRPRDFHLSRHRRADGTAHPARGDCRNDNCRHARPTRDSGRVHSSGGDDCTADGNVWAIHPRSGRLSSLPRRERKEGRRGSEPLVVDRNEDRTTDSPRRTGTAWPRYRCPVSSGLIESGVPN